MNLRYRIEHDGRELARYESLFRATEGAVACWSCQPLEYLVTREGTDEMCRITLEGELILRPIAVRILYGV